LDDYSVIARFQQKPRNLEMMFILILCIILGAGQVDPAPFSLNGKLKMENGKLFFAQFSIFHSPFSI